LAIQVLDFQAAIWQRISAHLRVMLAGVAAVAINVADINAFSGE
jgi:hypothetical protein